MTINITPPYLDGPGGKTGKTKPEFDAENILETIMHRKNYTSEVRDNIVKALERIVIREIKANDEARIKAEIRYEKKCEANKRNNAIKNEKLAEAKRLRETGVSL